MATWPSLLPQTFDRQNYQETTRDNLTRAQVGYQPYDTKRRTTSNPFMVSGTMFFNSSQWFELQWFFLNDIACGALPFFFPLQPLENDEAPYLASPSIPFWKVRFKSPPKRVHAGSDYWRVTLELEVFHQTIEADFSFTTSIVPPDPISIEFQAGMLEDTTDLTTYTFTGGGDGLTGLIVCSAHKDAGTSSAVSSASINGHAATIITPTAGAGPCGALFYAVVTNPTGDIVVTWNGTAARCLVGRWKILDYTSPTPIDSEVVNVATTTVQSMTLDLPAASVGVAVGTNGANANPSTWNVGTEEYDQSSEASCTASGVTLLGGAGAGQTVSSTHTSDLCTIAGAVWQ